MDIEKYIIKGKESTLYKAEKENAPPVILNSFSDDGRTVMEELKRSGCPPLMPQDAPFTGGADDHLKLLLTEIIPAAREKIKGLPSRVCIAGSIFPLVTENHAPVINS